VKSSTKGAALDPAEREVGRSVLTDQDVCDEPSKHRLDFVFCQ